MVQYHQNPTLAPQSAGIQPAGTPAAAVDPAAASEPPEFLFSEEDRTSPTLSKVTQKWIANLPHADSGGESVGSPSRFVSWVFPCYPSKVEVPGFTTAEKDMLSHVFRNYYRALADGHQRIEELKAEAEVVKKLGLFLRMSKCYGKYLDIPFMSDPGVQLADYLDR